MLTVRDHKDIYEPAVRRHEPIWKDWLECYDYVLGRQWTDAEIEWHRKWELVTRVYNITFSQVVTLDGYQITNRMAPKAHPVGPGDQKIAAQMTDVLQHFYREANAAQEFKRVLSDAMITGVGFMYSGWRNTAAHLDGTLDKRRLNLFDVLRDLEDIDPNRENDRFRIWTRWGDEDLAATAYGWLDDGLADEIRKRAAFNLPKEDRKKPSFLRSMRSNMSDWIDRMRSKGAGGLRRSTDYYDPNLGMYRFIELHYKTTRRQLVIVDPMSEGVIPIPEEYQKDRAVIAAALMELGLSENFVQSREVEVWRESVSMPGLFEDEILGEIPYPEKLNDRGCAIKDIVCYDFDPRKDQTRGVVHLVRDANDRVNRMMGLTEDLVRRRLHPDWLMDKRMQPRDHKDLQTWKSRAMAKLLLYNGIPGVAPPQRVDVPGIEHLISMDMNVNLELAPRITGVSPQLGGVKDSRKDGADLFQLQVQQAEIMINTIIDNAKASFVRQAQFDLGLIQSYAWYKRWIRITGRGGEVDAERSFYINDYDPELKRAAMDVSTGMYDVELSPTHVSPTERKFRFVERTQAMNLMDPMLRDFTFPEWVETSDWADVEELKRKWRVLILLKYGPMVLQMLEANAEYQAAMAAGGVQPDQLSQIMQHMQMMQGANRGDLTRVDSGFSPSGSEPGMQSGLRRGGVPQ